MRVSLKKGYDYVPVWNGNRDLPKDKQIVVHIEFMRGIDLTATVSERDPENMDTYYTRDFTAFCKGVENLWIQPEGEKTERLATPEDIATMPGLEDLYLEIRKSYNSETAVDKKK